MSSVREEEDALILLEWVREGVTTPGEALAMFQMDHACSVSYMNAIGLPGALKKVRQEFEASKNFKEYVRQFK